jgi:hypothetical protein
MARMSIETVMKALIALSVIVVVVLGTFIFVPRARDEFGELIGRFDIFLPSEVRDAQDIFEDYTKETVIPSLVNCRDSENANCWCMDETFEIPNSFSFVVVKDVNLKFNLLNNRGSKFSEFTFEDIQSCLVVEQGEFLMSDFENKEFLVKGGGHGDSTVYFKLENPINIGSGDLPGTLDGALPGKEELQYSQQAEFLNIVNLNLLFLKTQDGGICVVDAVRAEEYKNLKLCNQKV